MSLFEYSLAEKFDAYSPPARKSIIQLSRYTTPRYFSNLRNPTIESLLEYSIVDNFHPRSPLLSNRVPLFKIHVSIIHMFSTKKTILRFQFTTILLSNRFPLFKTHASIISRFSMNNQIFARNCASNLRDPAFELPRCRDIRPWKISTHVPLRRERSRLSFGKQYRLRYSRRIGASSVRCILTSE